MKEKIRKHINGLFTEAPKTRKAMELKEEMIQNTIEKYEDLVSEGYQEAGYSSKREPLDALVFRVPHHKN